MSLLKLAGSETQATSLLILQGHFLSCFPSINSELLPVVAVQGNYCPNNLNAMIYKLNHDTFQIFSQWDKKTGSQLIIHLQKMIV